MTVIVHFNDPLFKSAINDSQSSLYDNSAQLFFYALERYTACGNSFFFEPDWRIPIFSAKTNKKVLFQIG